MSKTNNKRASKSPYGTWKLIGADGKQKAEFILSSTRDVLAEAHHYAAKLKQRMKVIFIPSVVGRRYD